MRIGFLLGSGVSIPAGMASTEKLTEAVLRVEDNSLLPDGSFVRVDPRFLADYRWAKMGPLLKSLLQKLDENCRYYLEHCQNYVDPEKGPRSVNYEDLFFAANQLQEHLLEEYENPVIEPFIQQVLKDVPEIQGRTELKELADIVCDVPVRPSHAAPTV